MDIPMNGAKKTYLLALLFVSVASLGTLQGCGSGTSCGPSLLAPDPTGRWGGVMVRQESDCGDLSLGSQFSFEHAVSAECDSDDDSTIYLVNENNREFVETSSSPIGGGSFTVQYESSGSTIDISYDNYDGSLADVTQKIRLYVDGKLRCSERYRGQARK